MMKVIAIITCVTLVYSCVTSKNDDKKRYIDDYPCFYNDRVEIETPPVRQYLISYELSDTALKEILDINPSNIDPIQVVTKLSDTVTFYQCLNQIEYPELWKELMIEGSAYYGLSTNENGQIIEINALRTLYKEDLINHEADRVLDAVRFDSPAFYRRNLILRVKLLIR